LSVNLNAIAQLRNRRDLPWPSVTDFGRIALNAGAVGLTIHPRPDQRHIRFSDVPQLQRLISEEFPDREYNIEGYPTDAFLELAESASPESAQREIAKLAATAEAARAAGMGVNAGHDLTVDNLGPLLDAVPFVAEVSIGHAITADALEHGLKGSVLRYRAVCEKPREHN